MGSHFERALVVVLGLVAAAPALAQTTSLVPIRSGQTLDLGTAWNREAGRPIGDPGACVRYPAPVRHEGGAPTWTLLTLSRAGGRLLLGVHVSALVATEGVGSARLTDAALRLASSRREEFRALCGDGFVAARAWGAQYVGEIEVEPGPARRAAAALRTGVWSDPAPFEAAVRAVIGQVPASARELPDGRRVDAVPVEPEELLRRALAFPTTVGPDQARPFLASVRSYSANAIEGLAVEVDPTLGWGDAARAVFLADRLVLASSAAARAAEMRKAQVHREPTAAAGSGTPDASGAPPVAEPPAAGAVSAPAPAAPPVAVHRVAALVFQSGEGPPVFATTQAPPGVYAERVRQRTYWVPGAAQGTPAVRAALAAAAGADPVRGTTVIIAQVGATGVVLTDAAPLAGVHAQPAGELRAWIAGVGDPSPAQREALASAVRASAP